MQSITRQRLAEIPDLTRLAALYPQRYPCLLQSAVHGNAQSRWDIALAFPQSWLHCAADGRLYENDKPLKEKGFLAALDQRWRDVRTTPAQDDLPFHGGWVLYLSYELAAEAEPGLQLPKGEDGVPEAMALRCPAAVLIDHQLDQAWLVAEAGHEPLIESMQADIDRARPIVIEPLSTATLEEDPEQAFLDSVDRAHEYIGAGDVFQVNLSRAWRARFAVPPRPAAVYQALCQSNPAPFACLWQQPGWAVISSSPERLVEVRGRQVQTRPIAGTRPRVAGDDDRGRIDELLAHPKERAEHIMLIDLERNDLGRVCEPGSVEVNELMVVESHPHVHHIVSNVRGSLREGVTPGQVIAACFPGGTITGCPKIRCMQIIAELEGQARGAYTGAIGYLDRNGDMDLNILIRSFSQNARGLTLRAGAGIVHDSVAELELEETRAKARGLLKALRVTA